MEVTDRQSIVLFMQCDSCNFLDFMNIFSWTDEKNETLKLSRGNIGKLSQFSTKFWRLWLIRTKKTNDQRIDNEYLKLSFFLQSLAPN